MFIVEKNDERLVDTLESAIHNSSVDSAEMKGKIYFKSCIDSYELTSRGAQPLINAIFAEGT